MIDTHSCDNCEGIHPESCLFNQERRPSPFCAPYLTRKQTEEVWRLLHAQPQKKWAPHRKAVLKALRANAGNKHYLEKP